MAARDIGDLGQRLITPGAIAVIVFAVWLAAADRLELHRPLDRVRDLGTSSR